MTALPRAPTRPGIPARFIALLRAGHPGPCLVITAITVMLAVGAGAVREAGVGTLWLFAAAVLAGQFSIGWSNDYADARLDAAAGRTDKPVATGALTSRTVLAAAFAALTLCCGLGLLVGPVTAAWLVPVVGAGWAYNVGLKSTPLSGLAYVVGFGPLPGLATSILPGQPVPRPWALAAAALLGLGAHFVNVLPDLADDRAAGLRGLPHMLSTAAGAGTRGARTIRVVALALLLGASTLIALAPGTPARAAASTWLAAAGLVASVGLGVVVLVARGRTPFRCALAIAGINAAIFALAAGALV